MNVYSRSLILTFLSLFLLACSSTPEPQYSEAEYQRVIGERVANQVGLYTRAPISNEEKGFAFIIELTQRGELRGVQFPQRLPGAIEVMLRDAVSKAAPFDEYRLVPPSVYSSVAKIKLYAELPEIEAEVQDDGCEYDRVQQPVAGGRRLESLERFDLKKLQLHAVVTNVSGELVAQVMDSCDKPHTLRIGSRLGLNRGVVVSVQSDYVLIKELMPICDEDAWQERKNYLVNDQTQTLTSEGEALVLNDSTQCINIELPDAPTMEALAASVHEHHDSEGGASVEQGEDATGDSSEPSEGESAAEVSPVSNNNSVDEEPAE